MDLQTTETQTTLRMDRDMEMQATRSRTRSASGASSHDDDFIVTWENFPPNSNPREWSKVKKWTNTTLISGQATLSGIASTLLAVGNVAIAKDFNLTNPYTPNLPVALYVLGLGLAPLWLAPCSEIWGRRIVYLVSFGVFTILNIGCALSPNITALTILRLLSGMAASAGPSLGGATIGDMFSREDRGKAQSMYGFGPTGGPIIGGLIGGYIIQGTGGWRWTMWIMVIAPGITVTLSLFFLRETNASRLLRVKAAELRKETGKPYVVDGDPIDPRKMMAHSFVRPMKMLFCAPICTAMSIYIAFIYGVFYLFATTIPLLYGPTPTYGLFTYGWSTGNEGLAYLGIGVGIFLGVGLCARMLNMTYAYMIRRNQRLTGSTSTQGVPEYRMPFMQLGMFVLPCGLIIVAWTAQEQTYFLGPLIGSAVYGFGMIMAYICIQTYIVDSFEELAASALAATILLRSIFGCIFSVIGFTLYKNLGYAWGNMILAFVTLAMIPLPGVLYVYGARLRKASPKFE
ncbi:hypothetical protein MMC12_008709 [Toensbergia leucococca]|nr:hypothetical protein [Toensbergia leucococca]